MNFKLLANKLRGWREEVVEHSGVIYREVIRKFLKSSNRPENLLVKITRIRRLQVEVQRAPTELPGFRQACRNLNSPLTRRRTTAQSQNGLLPFQLAEYNYIPRKL